MVVVFDLELTAQSYPGTEAIDPASTRLNSFELCMLVEMRISVFSWITATFLATFSLWIIVAAYLDRNRAGCTPSCSDLRVPMIIAAGVLFGAIVSASIGQLSKSRPKYIKWLIRVGGVIFFLASSAFLISTSPVALVLIFVSLIVNTMIILRGRTHSTGNDHHVRSGKLP